MSERSSIFSTNHVCPFGTNLFYHLAANGAGLTAGELAVVTVLQVDANLSGGPANILKCPYFAVKRAASRWFRGVLR